MLEGTQLDSHLHLAACVYYSIGGVYFFSSLGQAPGCDREVRCCTVYVHCEFFMDLHSQCLQYISCQVLCRAYVCLTGLA